MFRINWNRNKKLSKKNRLSADEADKRLIKAMDMVKTNKPNSISKAVSLILGNGSTSCDVESVRIQMLDKHPMATHEAWAEPSDDDRAHTVLLKDCIQIAEKADPNVGTGPRGLRADYLSCLNRCRCGTDGPSGTPAEAFELNASAFSSSRTPAHLSP